MKLYQHENRTTKENFGLLRSDFCLKKFRMWPSNLFFLKDTVSQIPFLPLAKLKYIDTIFEYM